MTLFREEVVRRRAASLHGTITLALPVGWHVVSLLLAGIVALVGLFLASASYTRTEAARGSVIPEGGLLKVVAPRAGRVETVDVHEGDEVRPGQTLARIRVEEVDRQGSDAQAAVLRAMDDQRASLERQQALSRRAVASELVEADARITGLRDEIGTLDAQLATQQALVDMARSDLGQARQIASRGFISRRDLSVREETLLSREQQAAAIRQTRAAKRANLSEALAGRGRTLARGDADAASLAREGAQGARERATASAERGYALVATRAGRVAALSIFPGDAVSPQDVAMQVVPRGGRLLARLYLPVKASGFVRSGQPVRLALDAFPYERFGTVQGVVTSVSDAPVMRRGTTGPDEPFYVAMAAVSRPFVTAYGQRRPLVPGMTFSARIVTDRRTLMQWLFDPLYAVAGS